MSVLKEGDRIYILWFNEYNFLYEVGIGEVKYTTVENFININFETYDLDPIIGRRLTSVTFYDGNSVSWERYYTGTNMLIFKNHDDFMYQLNMVSKNKKLDKEYLPHCMIYNYET